MSKRYAPATERNRDPILDVLQTYLPKQGTVLEVSAGTGQHAAFFAPLLAPRYWLPTDVDETSLSSIQAWRATSQAPNLLAPQRLDVLDTRWLVEDAELPEPLNAMVSINMVHIAPWRCCEALFDGAQRILPAKSVVLMYGPFKKGGEHTSPSNAAFDHQLKAENARWGVRDLESVIDVAKARGFSSEAVIPMPANNLMVSFTRA